MTPLTGHLGLGKTQTKGHETLLLSKTRDEVACCHSSHSCQVAEKSNQKIPGAPQTPSPVVRLFFLKFALCLKLRKEIIFVDLNEC